MQGILLLLPRRPAAAAAAVWQHRPILLRGRVADARREDIQVRVAHVRREVQGNVRLLPGGGDAAALAAAVAVVAAAQRARVL